MIIDAWIQHPTPRLLGQPFLKTVRRWAGIGDGPVPEMPVALTVGALKAAGVDRALCTAWVGPRGDLVSNDEVAAFCAEAPDHLVGVASVDLFSPMDAVRELRRCVKELGFRGLRMLPWLWRLPPNDRRYYPLYAECIELGVPFCLQVGHTGPLMPSEPGRPIPYLEEVVLDFPELVVVGGHIGYPWHLEMLSLARRFDNVYIDTSAYTPRRYPAELVAFMRSKSGRHKVLFGSNYPMIMPSACLNEVDDLELDAQARELFLAGNAARVFGLTV
jgi:predicted TIM-barrel fold metal-dependent hydrolase